MDKNRIRLAVIGVGYWGRNLARVFSQLGVLDTICDSDPNKLIQAKRDYSNVNVTLSYNDVLKNKTIQAVVISTPAESHYNLAKRSLLAGKDVFVEKPMALTVKDGRELLGLSDKNKKILMVGHLLEYHPAINKLKELIKNGKLGKIQYIYSNRLNLGRFRREENILWSFAPHDISVMLLLLNKTPESVSVCGGEYLHHGITDVTVSNLNFANGIKGHIFVSWLHPYKEQKLVIIGDKKMLVFDDVKEREKLLIYNHKIDWVNGKFIPKKEFIERIKFKAGEPLLFECKHFLNCLKTRKAPKTDGKSALRVLKVLQACQMSLDKGGISILLDSIDNNFSSLNNKYYAHPTSIVEQPCRIGEGTKIWHYSHIMKGAKIGKYCTIGQNVFISSRVEIGDKVKIQNNVSIYDGVKLEDDVFCGPSVVFTNVINPRSHVSRKNEYKETLVKSGATLGANSTIICGNAIGEYAFIGGGTVVTKNVPSYALVYGNPARLKGWMCKCGVKLNLKNNKAICSSCNRKYILNNDTIKCITRTY